MNIKKLSIIIPCYNIEKYITRCIESIIPQVNSAIEVLVINDGSTDSSRQILSKLEEKYKNVFSVRDFSNGGLATARNRGIENTVGEYLWFIDGDDFISSEAIDTLLNVIDKTDADMIAFNHSENTENGINKIDNYQKGTFSITEFLRLGSRHFAWNKIYKRKIFSKYRFIDGLRNIEDFVFNLSISPAICNVETLNKYLYIYECTNSSSISRDRSPRHLIQLTQETFKAHKILTEKFADINDSALRKLWIEQLTTSYAGHIFSLLRFYNCRMVCRAINVYKNWGVYPFPYTGNYRQNVFSFFVNHKQLWPLYKLVRMVVE